MINLVLRLAAFIMAILLTSQRLRTIYEVGMTDKDLDQQPDDYREAERVGQLLEDYSRLTTANEREKMLGSHPELEGLVDRPVNVLRAYDDYVAPTDKAQRDQEVENARRQGSSIRTQVQSNSLNVDSDTKEVLEELLVEAELPDELGGDIAALQLVNLVEAAKAAHLAARPFGRVTARRSTTLADGGAELWEKDAFGKEQITRYSADEVQSLEAEHEAAEAVEKRPWGDAEGARQTTLEAFDAWTDPQQILFLEEHSDIADALVRDAERGN